MKPGNQLDTRLMLERGQSMVLILAGEDFPGR